MAGFSNGGITLQDRLVDYNNLDPGEVVMFFESGVLKTLSHVGVSIPYADSLLLNGKSDTFFTPITVTDSITASMVDVIANVTDLSSTVSLIDITTKANKVATGEGVWNTVVVNSEGVVTSGAYLSAGIGPFTANKVLLTNTNGDVITDLLTVTLNGTSMDLIIQGTGSSVNVDVVTCSDITAYNATITNVSSDTATISNLSASNLTTTNHVSQSVSTSNIRLTSDSYMYMGDPNVIGCWRIGTSGSNLVIEHFEDVGGNPTWVQKSYFS